MHPRLKLLFAVALAVLSVVLALGGLNSTPVQAQNNEPLRIYFFWGDGCPHCAEAEPVLAGLIERYPNVELRAFEVWYNTDNQFAFKQMYTKFGFEPQGVPTIFIGDQHWSGYNESVGQQIEAAISNYLAAGQYPDAAAGVDLGKSVPVITGPTSGELPAQPTAVPTVDPNSHEIKIPLIGTINLDSQSLLVSTLLIAFVDGVNPCSLWVLTMLLALVLHTGSRKKIVLIGLIFLTITAGVYALFIVGLFSLLTFVNYLTWVEVLVAVVALVFALINIKDYFWYKEGVSLTIADDKKPGLMARMRKLATSSDSLLGLAGATMVLAAGVSLVEFSCTAGFPVVWTNLLSTQNVTTGDFILLLLVYLLIYQLDELVIFFTVVFTLKASRLEEKHGRILKLIGGTLMLVLAVVMIVNPALMNNLSSSLIIFGIAFGAALLVLLVHRRILPAFGIWIGSEKPNMRKGARKRNPAKK